MSENDCGCRATSEGLPPDAHVGGPDVDAYRVEVVLEDGSRRYVPHATQQAAAQEAGRLARAPRAREIVVSRSSDGSPLLRLVRGEDGEMVPAPGDEAISAGLLDDVAHGLAQADHWIDKNVMANPKVQSLLQSNPYTSAIPELHRARMSAIYGDEGATAPREAPNAPRAPARGEAPTLEGLVREAQAVTRAARLGDAGAQARIVRLKEAAAAGDPSARRMWKIYNLAADQDAEAIDRAMEQDQ